MWQNQSLKVLMTRFSILYLIRDKNTKNTSKFWNNIV